MQILIAEDEALIAMDLSMAAEDVGAEVVGPFQSAAEGLSAIAEARPDSAILDVNLLDGEVFELADALQERGVPIVFHSGHATVEQIRQRYPNAEFCAKPCSADAVVQMVSSLQQRSAERA